MASEDSAAATLSSPTPPAETADDLFLYRPGLASPVIGMEAEFELLVDGRATEPEELWRSPSDFIDVPLLQRSTKSSQLPTGGALYFDKGVLEVVTPVIELASACTTRMVRSAWEQIEFVRHHLDRWQQQEQRDVQLKAFSSHFNISFELSRDERNRDRTIQKLALLLAYVLPIPVMVLGANRRSTGVGVRPRRERVEITLDFTPDPGLMLATAALIVGIARDVIAWPSYRIDQLDELPFELPASADPGKHTTRKGWLSRAQHFERSPFTADLDAREWETRRGNMRSLREIAWSIARFFRGSIRKVSDPFSTRLLFSILEGRTASMLDLADRPAAYDDIGRSIRWGTVLPELSEYSGEAAHSAFRDEAARTDDEHTNEPELAESDDRFPVVEERREPAFISSSRPTRRAADLHALLDAPWTTRTDRRTTARPVSEERRRLERRKPLGADVATIDRSRYENVFVQLASGRRIEWQGRSWTPQRMRGWYEVEVTDEASGEERRISIDQLAKHDEVWR